MAEHPKTQIRGRRVLTVPADEFLPRRPPRMKIGQEFPDPATGDILRVTDVGTRTFLTINTTRAQLVRSNKGERTVSDVDPKAEGLLSGPPYAVVERVWDETDYSALRSVVGIEWDDPNSEVIACDHPEDQRHGFFPSSTSGGHERCTGCGCVRYQAAGGGPWGPWEYVNEDVE